MESTEVLEALKPAQTAAGEYVRYWTRFWAMVLDGWIILLGLGALGAQNAFWLSLLAGWLYPVLMECSPKQATLGKLILGIQVTDAEGKRIGFKTANKRFWLKYPFMARAWFFCFIAYILRKRDIGLTVLLEQPFWHDRFAGTLVVKGAPGGAVLPVGKRIALAAAIFVAGFGITALRVVALDRAKPAPTPAARTAAAKPAPAPAAEKPAAAAPEKPAAATPAAAAEKPAAAAPAQPEPAEPEPAVEPEEEAEPAESAPAPAAPREPAVPLEEILDACGNEAGLICSGFRQRRSALIDCLRENWDGLLPACRKKLRKLED